MEGITQNSSASTESAMQNSRTPSGGSGSQFVLCLERLGTSFSLSKSSSSEKDHRETNVKNRKNDANNSSAHDPGKSKEQSVEKKSNRDIDSADDRGPGSSIARHAESQPALFETHARSILHVADFERIVAQIRTQKTVDSTSVLVKLNNSIFEGLELRVSLKEGRGLTAEFIALNDAVKTSIENRSAELIRMFADRGIQLSSISVSVGSEKRDDSGSSQHQNPQKSNTALKTTGLEIPISNDSNLHFSGTSYLT